MSTFQAIGGVSATFQALLRDRMELPPGVPRTDLQVTVSIPPVEDLQPPESPRVNLFLYRVTENGALKNQMIPGQGHPSELGHPPLSLVLHYLLTAYGATDENGLFNETRAHFLLGSAMRVFHDHPVITDKLVTVQVPTGQTILHPSLRGEFEQVKLCLDPLNLEDLSKVWTALTRPYRLSAAYSVSVVQIESRRLRTLAAPVKTRRIHIAISRRPQISAVYRTPVLPGEVIGDVRAHVGRGLTIEGQSFRAFRTWVKLGNLEPIGVQPDSDEQIRIVVPDDTYPVDADPPGPRPIPVDDQLRPGPQAVEVQTLHPSERVEGGLDPGVVVKESSRQSSNQGVFLLTPEVTGATPSGSPPLLTVTGKRLYKPPARSVVVAGDVSIPVQDPGPDLLAPPTDISVKVPLSGFTPGTYPVRVMVNGAQSMEDVTFTLP